MFGQKFRTLKRDPTFQDAKYLREQIPKIVQLSRESPISIPIVYDESGISIASKISSEIYAGNISIDSNGKPKYYSTDGSMPQKDIAIRKSLARCFGISSIGWRQEQNVNA